MIITPSSLKSFTKIEKSRALCSDNDAIYHRNPKTRNRSDIIDPRGNVIKNKKNSENMKKPFRAKVCGGLWSGRGSEVFDKPNDSDTVSRTTLRTPRETSFPAEKPRVSGRAVWFTRNVRFLLLRLVITHARTQRFRTWVPVFGG